jgi:hypothetical protein
MVRGRATPSSNSLTHIHTHTERQAYMHTLCTRTPPLHSSICTANVADAVCVAVAGTDGGGADLPRVFVGL